MSLVCGAINFKNTNMKSENFDDDPGNIPQAVFALGLADFMSVAGKRSPTDLFALREVFKGIQEDALARIDEIFEALQKPFPKTPTPPFWYYVDEAGRVINDGDYALTPSIPIILSESFWVVAGVTKTPLLPTVVEYIPDGETPLYLDGDDVVEIIGTPTGTITAQMLPDVQSVCLARLDVDATPGVGAYQFFAQVDSGLHTEPLRILLKVE